MDRKRVRKRKIEKKWRGGRVEVRKEVKVNM
jgi:hypothetical protein